MSGSLISSLLQPTKLSWFTPFKPAKLSSRPHGRRMLALRATAQTEDREGQVRAEVTRRIKALGRAGKPREAVQQLAEMAKLGVQPDTLAATALLDACARCGKLDMMQAVFDELFANGDMLVPDDVTFAVLIRGYGGSEPPRWTAISNCLNTMEGRYGAKPAVAVFNALLEVCARTNDETRAAEILSRMEAAGVVPNEQTFEAVAKRRSLRSMLKRTFGGVQAYL